MPNKFKHDARLKKLLPRDLQVLLTCLAIGECADVLTAETGFHLLFQHSLLEIFEAQEAQTKPLCDTCLCLAQLVLRFTH